MADPSLLQVFDRKNHRLISEKIFGEGGVRFLYQHPVGRFLEETLLSRKWFSQLYGAYQDSFLSRRDVAPFVRNFEIPMEDYESGPFSSFNEFFIRKFRPGIRAFDAAPKRLPAPAEGRYHVFESVRADTALPVKGAILDGKTLLGTDPRMSRFFGGPGLIARLCPVDYHRFHFPDAGRSLAHFHLKGPLHSVNPYALATHPELLFRNFREVSLLETENFGSIAYVEVGAIGVGRIIQTHPLEKPFRRGDEKGYFQFGGSTVILLGEPGRFRFDPDMLEKTKVGVETLVRLGEGIATAR